MNREIKFRAWDPIVKKMYYPFGLLDVCIPDLGEPSVAQQSFRHCGYINKGQLMQFTGLKDSKGIEIYEGDIVSGNMSYGESHIAEVKWKIFMWEAISKGGNNMIIWLEDGLTVIGNIFENPELLK
jgi:uncharacterized phage protein (TIGR01671 family)